MVLPARGEDRARSGLIGRLAALALAGVAVDTSYLLFNSSVDGDARWVAALRAHAQPACRKPPGTTCMYDGGCDK